MSDPIGNMLCQITNASHKFKETVEMPSSKLKVELARVLKEEGFISHYKVVPDRIQSTLKLGLKYAGSKERVIQGMKRVSKQGLRVFRGWEEIPSVQNGLGSSVISTSKGVMSGDQARKNKLGGWILCFVW